MTFAARVKSYSLGAPHYLFGVVVVMRVIVLARLAGSPFLLPARGDMHFYNDWALRILRGEGGEAHAFYGLPGYAYLLALIYRVIAYNPFIPGLLQALLDGGVAVILYKLAERLFEGGVAKIVGIAAAIGWALFVPAQAYSSIVMPTTWLVFVFWLVVWCVVRRESAPTLLASALIGLLIGLTATVVATILFLIPLVCTAIILKRGAHRPPAVRIRLASVALLFGGVVAGTAPCWIHNYFLARDPVFLSAHSGINFWSGNNPSANGYPRFPPGLRAGQAAMLQDSIDVAESAAGHQLKRAEVSQYWSAQAKRYITGDFGGWLRLLAIKLRNFWSAFQYDDLSIITSLREEGVLLPGLYFGVVAAFGLPGMIISWRAAPRSRWITTAILLHMCSLLTVFTTERYRLAVVPGLMLLGAYGIALLWKNIARLTWRPTLAYLSLIASATASISWPQPDPTLWALDAYNSGWQALEANNYPVAEKKLRLALAYVPTNPETNFALGNLRLAQDDISGAAGYYRDTLSYNSRHRGALNNLAVLALRQHELADAQRWLNRALEVDPNNAKTHFLLAETFLAAGDIAGARAEADRALTLQPGQQEFREFRDQVHR